MSGGNKDSVAAGDEFPKISRGDSGSTCDTDGATSRDVRFGKDWHDDLLSAVHQMRTASLDQGIILVTDALGIELHLEDKGLARLTGEHFPLRIRLTAAPAANASLLRSSPPSEGKGSSSSIGSGGSSKVWRGNQVSVEIEFGDVWPGILRRRLEMVGVVADPLLGDGTMGFLVATDARGVEVDMRSARKRMPSPDRFPLKLHFHAPRSGPQNVEQGKHQDSKGKDSRKNSSNSKVPPTVCEHSMDLVLTGMLSDIVDVKLEDLGLCLEETMRSRVLITDCLGVIVDPSEGVPEMQRFPIKAHIEGSFLSEIECNDGGGRWFGRRRSTSDMALRMTSACESAMTSFRRARGGSKSSN